MFEHPLFEVAMTLLIIACVVLTAMNPPTEADVIPLSRTESLLIELVFVALFGTEFLLKGHVFGFVAGTRPVLRDMWGVIDLSVLTAMVTDIVLVLASGSRGAEGLRKSILRAPTFSDLILDEHHDASLCNSVARH